MTIENDLGRIATALERLANLADATAKSHESPGRMNVLATAPAVAFAGAAAEPAAEAKAQPARRGRPPKVTVTTVLDNAPITGSATTQDPAVATTPTTDVREPAPAADALFGDDPTPAAAPTVDDVKQALSDLVGRVNARTGDATGGEGRKAAYKILTDYGNKAVRLPGSPADAANPAAPGALKPEYFAAVIEAANKGK